MSRGKGTFTINPPLGRPVDYSNGISNGLICYWPLNEGGGQLALDAAGRRMIGTLGNSSTFTRTTKGSATTTVSMGAQVPLQFTNTQPFSVSCWVNFSNVTTSGNTLFSYAVAGSGQGWYCEMAAVGSGLLNFDYFDGSRFARATNSGFAISASTWTHIVCVRNGLNTSTSNSIYLNGVDRSTRSASGVLPNSAAYSTIFAIGARGTVGSGGRHLLGSINNIAIWRRALTPNEAKILYTQPYTLLK